MRPRPYRKIVTDLTNLLEEKGIAVEASNEGKGSHRTLTFVDNAVGQRLPVVIAGSKEVSKVVQREILAYLNRRSEGFAVGHPARDHTERVRKILDAYFNS